MNAAHPEECPDIIQLAGMLGLGLSPEAAKLLVHTDYTVEQILTWVDECPACISSLETLETWQEEVAYPDFAIVAHERNRALALWAKLENLPTEELADQVGEEHCFWAMCQLLADRGSAEAHRSAERAVQLSEIAIDLSLALDETRYSPRLVADQRARTWAVLGNAQRVGGHFRLAEASFREALKNLARGTGATYSRGVVLFFLGCLLNSKFQAEQAYKAFDEAVHLFESCGSRDYAAKANISLANLEYVEGDLRAGIARLTRVQAFLDPSMDSSLQAMCQSQLVHLLTEAGLYEEAELRLDLVKRLYVGTGDESNQLRVRWVEARIQRGLGRILEAREVFFEVIDGLVRLGRDAEVGLAKLDLACLFCVSRNFQEVERLSREALAAFEKSGASAQAQAALSVVNELVQAKQVTAGVIQQLIRYLSTPGLQKRSAFSPAEEDAGSSKAGEKDKASTSLRR